MIHPHIGELIEARVQKMGMTSAEFARRISTSRQNARLIYNRHALQTDRLVKIGKVLNYDFFQQLTTSKEPPREHPKMFLMVGLPTNQDELARIMQAVNAAI